VRGREERYGGVKYGKAMGLVDGEYAKRAFLGN
jgi:hypothetical protein